MPNVPIRFEDVRFDVDARQVWRAGQLVHVSPKAFALLTLLVERRPNPVDKATIQERLWPGTFVSDTNLPALVAEIRDALGDDARHPRFIRTVHGIGYAFQAAPDGEPIEPGSPAGLPQAWLMAEERRLALYPGDNVLGREGPGVVVVDSSTVSRRHARIVIGRDATTVEDLGSKNGTFVNDRQVSSPTAVSDGDQVRIGSRLFTFRVASTATSTQTRSSTERG
jgi:DNA-binding winged helix-turn-helix (wHTH) protein